MKRKSAETGKGSSAKQALKRHTTSSMNDSDRFRMNKPTKVTEDPRFAQAVQNYEAGLKAMQSHKYDRAKTCFEKVVGGASPELSDRAAVHLNTCNQQLSRATTQFKTPEEQYDYAISLMNMGDYLSARENFETLVKKHPQLDYVWYGMAALNCLMGHFPDSIGSLTEAIRLNPANRFQARNDSDFKGLADDPRFTELLYPDTSAEMPSESQKWQF
jgi:tetratricopeptide (TPR) repeat protein